MARPCAPDSRPTSTSTVGLPRESRTSRPSTKSIPLTAPSALRRSGGSLRSRAATVVGKAPPTPASPAGPPAGARTLARLAPRLDLRLRVASAELLGLPWLEPLGEWDATTVDIRDVPVGPSRHLVRFVEADDRLWALKEMPEAIA